jgi:hypothetical protein
MGKQFFQNQTVSWKQLLPSKNNVLLITYDRCILVDIFQRPHNTIRLRRAAVKVKKKESNEEFQQIFIEEKNEIRRENKDPLNQRPTFLQYERREPLPHLFGRFLATFTKYRKRGMLSKI